MSRVLIAGIVGLIGFCVYIVAAMLLFDQVAGLNWAIQALYFLVAGVLWVIPARSLMLWAARG
jgi:hypothetical protein